MCVGGGVLSLQLKKSRSRTPLLEILIVVCLLVLRSIVRSGPGNAYVALKQPLQHCQLTAASAKGNRKEGKHNNGCVAKHAT